MMAARSPSRARKTVTVVFSDVAGSTRLGSNLDPEAVRSIMSRYFEAASRALERHGGTVEKFIGDAVMAVFGIPAVHEDDALRAVRAVVEMHDAVDELNRELEHEQGLQLRLRTGVNTGEVVVGDPADGQTLVTGDTVNVAARLEQAAGPGEILIGEVTHRLVRDAVKVEPTGPLTLKGKEEGVPSWRVLELSEDGPGVARSPDAPLVGRASELERLREIFDVVVGDERASLFTVLGGAGIGKSRLARELEASVADEARVLRGRCLPYGDGITYWPLFEIVRYLVDEEDPRSGIARLVAGREGADAIAERIAGVLGHSTQAGSAEETSWAVRKLFEALAQERPLVVVFEDLHWGEPALLDLIEYIVAWSREAPIFILCLARPELLEKRPRWGGGEPAASLLLEPLTAAESGALIDSLQSETGLSPATRERIAATAEGNPLYVEQMVAMLAEGEPAEGALEIPPTIQGLLAARLDRLGADERAVIERACVVGKRFWAGAVADLSSESGRGSVEANLEILVRKDFIGPDHPPVVPAEVGYRFRHQLIRDAAYNGIPKGDRAALHERFARLIEERAGSNVVEVEEILGYHLEQAVRYRSELGRPDEHVAALSAEAAERLARSGGRAHARGDAAAATNLLGRAAVLLPKDAAPRAELLGALGSALVLAGDLTQADAVLTEAIEAGAASGNRRLELHAMLERAFLRALTHPDGVEELRRVAEQALPVLEELGDELGLAKAWRRIADVHWMVNHWSEQAQALEQALVHAQRAGDDREAAGALMRLPMSLYYGPMPVAEATARAEAILERAQGARVVQSTALVCLAGLHAMSGRFEEARPLLAQGRAISDELGFRVWVAGFSLAAGDIEMLADDPVAAERELRRGYEALETMGERALLATIAAELARAVCAQGRYEEAEQLTRVSEELARPLDVSAQIAWRTVRATCIAAGGDLADAEDVARKALQAAEQTDDLNRQARVLVDLADVVRRASREPEAVLLREKALALFERKGNVVLAERVQSELGRARSPQ
jgi:class 3 adenylate cyclase/tetratricopeptide (TPR) repeat protein